MIEFIQDWWTLGLLIAWLIAAEIIVIRDAWPLIQAIAQAKEEEWRQSKS